MFLLVLLDLDRKYKYLTFFFFYTVHFDPGNGSSFNY